MRFGGFVWYQGEANAKDADHYTCMFSAMISDWRDKFDATVHDTPFLFVQLAPYVDSGNSNFPALRWAQTVRQHDKTVTECMCIL